MEPIAVIASKFPTLVIPLINQAVHTIDIIVFDWRFYPTIGGSSVSQFNAAIFAAARRGVRVRCLVNSAAILDRLKQGGCEAKLLHSKRMLHTKMMILDNTKVVLGSHNYTQHGFSMNHEASVIVEMSTENNDFKTYFEGMWGV